MAIQGSRKCSLRPSALNANYRKTCIFWASWLMTSFRKSAGDSSSSLKNAKYAKIWNNTLSLRLVLPEFRSKNTFVKIYSYNDRK